MKFSNLLPDLPFPKTLLSKIFLEQHEQNLERFPDWSVMATRRKLSGSYWLEVILNHFSLLMIEGFLIVFLLEMQMPVKQLLLTIIPTSFIIFLVLFFAMYWPLYQLEFLPHLDSCIENYKGQQLDQIQQCKKNQYSAVTLMLIQQAYSNLAGFDNMLVNTENSKILAKQYGVSEKSIGNALKLIVHAQWDHKSIRKRTEILNDFQEAKDYFSKMSFDLPLKWLDKMEQKILKAK